MTIYDVINIPREQLVSPTQDFISHLPNLLDVMEFLSAEDNNEMIRQSLPIPDYISFPYQKYILMADKAFDPNPQKILFRLSQTPFSFYRGQNAYHANCQPPIYRMKNSCNQRVSQNVAHILTAEFLRAIRKHSVIQKLADAAYIVNEIAIAEHYGFATNCLDITTDKWTALFFAGTEYDGQTDTYKPISDDLDNTMGVLYYKPAKFVNTQMLNDEIKFIGYQFGPRPSQQYACVCPLKSDDNFDAHPSWLRIIFRQDKEVSRLIYNMAHGGRLYFPDDSFAEVAHKILAKGYSVSWTSVSMAKKEWGIMENDDQLKSDLHEMGYDWHNGEDIIADFSKEQMRADVELWNYCEKVNLLRLTQPMPLVSPYPPIKKQ